MTDAACKIGDYAVHREESYTFAYYNRSLLPRNTDSKDLESGLHGIIMGRALPEEPHHLGRSSVSHEGEIGPASDITPPSTDKKVLETKKEA